MALREIGENVYVYTGVYNDELRVKIKKLLPDEQNRLQPVDYKGISLSLEQWEKIVSLRDEIEAEIAAVSNVESERKKSWRISGNRFVSVSRFRSKYGNTFLTVVDIRVYFMRDTEQPINPTRYGMCLKTVEWETLASHMSAIDRDIKGIDTVPVEVMKECVAFTVQKSVTSLSRVNCHGCRVDHPSQKQHMVNGCLSEWVDQLEEYFVQAKESLSWRDVLSLYMRTVNDEDAAGDPFKIYKEVVEQADVMALAKARQWKHVKDE